MPDVDRTPGRAGGADAGGEAGAPDAATRSKADAWAWVIIGLLGIPMLALGIGALVLPPGIAFSLVRRGSMEHRPSWMLLGGLVGLLWLVMLFFAGRRIMSPAKGDAATTGKQTRG